VTAVTQIRPAHQQIDPCALRDYYDPSDRLDHGGAVSTWKVAEAKARFSELIEKALTEGPQEVTRHGKQAVVVLSADEWQRRTRRKGSLIEFLERSPLRGSELRIERLDERPPDVEL
jgi:prevent-host-death family protein